MITREKFVVCILHPFHAAHTVKLAFDVAGGYVRVERMTWAQLNGAQVTSNRAFQNMVKLIFGRYQYLL